MNKLYEHDTMDGYDMKIKLKYNLTNIPDQSKSL